MLSHKSCFILLMIFSITTLLSWKYMFVTRDGSFNALRGINNILDDHSFKINTTIVNFRIVTAFSGNHVVEATRSCKSIGNLKETQNWMPGYMIAYILKDDVLETELDIYRINCPFVTVRYFDSTMHKEIGEALSEYRWKPVLVYEVLQEVDKVFWIDASILFHENKEETLMDLINNMDKNFDKCGIRFVSETFHSIFSATHPSTLQYFNVSTDTAKSVKMFESGWFVVSKKAFDIVRNWKNCAMEKECMAPSGSQQPCDYAKLRKGDYGNCHRYDQAVLNIITLKCSMNSTNYYKPSPLLSVKRLGDFDRLTFPPRL